METSPSQEGRAVRKRSLKKKRERDFLGKGLSRRDSLKVAAGHSVWLGWGYPGGELGAQLPSPPQDSDPGGPR